MVKVVCSVFLFCLIVEQSVVLLALKYGTTDVMNVSFDYSYLAITLDI